MKTAPTVLIASLFLGAAGVAAAQSSALPQAQPPAAPSSSAPLPPERPQLGGASGLNLKLDDSARRSIVTSTPEERPAPPVGGGLPGLGAGARTFEPAGGFGRPRSDAKTYPKSADW